MIFGSGVKVRALIECLHEGWAPYCTRCRRGEEKITLTKSGWAIEFGQQYLTIYGPKKGALAKEAVVPTYNIYSNPPEPWRLLLGRKNQRIFDLRRPELGMQKLPPAMPDFKYLRQFVHPIHRLTQLFGRPPCQWELVADVYGILNRDVSQKAIIALYHEGDGYFWTSKQEFFDGGGRRKRNYYLNPDMTIPQAEKLWKERMDGCHQD